MHQRDLVRFGAWAAAAGVGAGVALAGAALTGGLGGSTTIEQIAAPNTPTPSPSPTGKLSIEQIYRLDAPGVVQITGSAKSGSVSAPRASTGAPLGSGFVIDKAGHIITSSRVISGSPSLHVRFTGNDALAATLVGRDPATDVAVLQVDAHSRSLTPLPLGDSDLVQVGDQVVAIGNSTSLDRTATVGVVSSVQHGVDASTFSVADHAIRTDASIDSGNSGGPLINSAGEVIGVNSPIGSSVGGFAIPIDTVKSVVAQLLAHGTVQHAYLGIDAVPVSRSVAHSFALPSGYGLLVERVTSGAPAATAGLRAGTTPVVVAGESYRIGGDIIVAADGKAITSVAELRNVLETKKPGDRLSLQLWRGTRKETVDVTLGRPPG